MSVATTIPCIRITTTKSSSSKFRVSHSSKSCMSFSTVRCSQTEGPIRRPVAPSPPSLQPPSPSPPVPPKPSALVEDKSGGGGVVTLEFQRAKARELQEFFKQKKLEDAAQGPVFGWVPKNEIGNGRWAMFGFAVGMLTEYATGSDFVDQLKLILSNLGIVDLD
ncbi:hypothetical protein RND81_02G076400 [Saponaria officinalis]|uniref:Uncharacterized protein n=1 Tax=Saponaria officinalis TaxID=3572 RepID=A0AAW1MWM0_SAPOF